MVYQRKIKWGIVGLGKIARQFANELMLVEEAQIAAVASRDATKAQKFANIFGCKKAYGNYDEIFDDDEIDIIYIATPHNSHAELSIKALEKNKHVLCEKPIALSYEDAFNMVMTSQEHNKFLMEAFWTRFNPTFLDVLDNIKKGKLGEIKYVNADFAFTANTNELNRFTDLKLGGGALMDIGIYPLFLAYMILGLPEEIVAKSNFHHSGVDLQTSIIFHYEKAQAVLHCGLEYNSKIEAVISGTKGEIKIEELWYKAQSYSFSDSYSAKKYDFPTKGIGYTHEIEECHRCLKNQEIESPLWTHQNSLELISLLDKVREIVGLKFPLT